MPANVIARKLKALHEKASIRSVDVANVLQIRPETVSRWNQGKAFPQPDAERVLLDLEYVVDQLADIYDPDEARLWLFSRQRLLDGKIPAELIQQHRTEEVLQAIRLADHGVSLDAPEDRLRAQRAAIGDLCRQYGVQQLALFGSALRADFDPARSDLDFVVEFSASGSPAQQYFGFKSALEILLGRPVDLVELAAMPDSRLRRLIERTRRPVYGQAA